MQRKTLTDFANELHESSRSSALEIWSNLFEGSARLNLLERALPSAFWQVMINSELFVKILYSLQVVTPTKPFNPQMLVVPHGKYPSLSYDLLIIDKECPMVDSPRMVPLSEFMKSKDDISNIQGGYSSWIRELLYSL